MMRIIIYSLGVFLLFVLLDKLGLWLESKGWLYYRKRKSNSSILGSSLQELNAIFMPSNRHVIEAKQNKVAYKKHEADAPSEPMDNQHEMHD